MGARGNSRRDPVADPAGPGRAWWPSDDERRRRRPGPRALAAAVDGGLRRGDAPGRGHDPHRGPRGVGGGQPRRPTAGADLVAVLDAARGPGGRRAGPHARHAARAQGGRRGRRRRRRLPAPARRAAPRASTAGPCPSPTPIDGARRGPGQRPMAHAGHGEGDDGGIADLRYEVMYFLEAPDDDHPGVQGRVGRHRRLDRRGRRRRPLELPHPHRRHRRRRSRPPSTSGAPRNIRVTDLLEQVEEERWVREAAPELAGVVGHDAGRRPRSSPWPPATASAASSTRSACRASSPAASP